MKRRPSRCGACGVVGHIVTKCPDPIRRAAYRLLQVVHSFEGADCYHGTGSWQLRQLGEVATQLEKALDHRVDLERELESHRRNV